ncbi:uncharacterized protein LOC103316417 [Nasonia vitripennis]|uniref:Peptidase aspartic putative domain-containing protein n=1 Tax=Nasonia vitripennis TaxID=7425 RepID=A0A7M7HC72_NASVI|nr:uncharacterized protein LOC103316417 [Nasonia vitripennis]
MASPCKVAARRRAHYIRAAKLSEATLALKQQTVGHPYATGLFEATLALKQHTVYGLQRIGIITPAQPMSTAEISFIQGLELADPEFNVPRGIEVILGANVYARVLLSNAINRKRFLAQRTVFGWVLTGATINHQTSPALTTACTLNRATEESPCHEQLIELLQRFWSMEDVPKTDRNGRYIVPLPLKAGGASLLGESLTQARIALSTMHRCMKRDPKLEVEYVKLVEDYIRLGHMRRLTPSEIENLTVAVCYICHHDIYQKGDIEDKLRVVFNASWPTSSGYSLNDVMHAGPKLQNDLAVVVTR